MAGLEHLLVKPLNHLIGDAAWASERLRRHAGALVQIDAGSLRLSLQIDGEGLFRPSAAGAPADVGIALADDFLAQALVDRQRLMATARLSGSAEIAETLAFVFRNLHWDVEGDLARVIGDIPARRLALAGAALGHAGRSAASQLVDNLAACVTDSAGPLVAEAEIAGFKAGLGRLGDDLGLLERRLARLGG